MPETDRIDWQRKLAMAAIVIAGCAAYADSFGNAWVYPHVADIVDNPTIRHLWPLGPVLRPPVSGGMTVGGRPVLNLSLAFNYALGGTAVWGYHALNLLIHLATGLTLFGIVRRTMRGSGATLTAFAVALLWTLHPLQTESVTYVIERAESLMGLFYLLTLYCFIRYADEMPPHPDETLTRSAPGTIERNETLLRIERSGTRQRFVDTWGVGAVVCCALGMATKEVMVSAPAIVFLYDRTFLSGGFRSAWRNHRRVHLALACTWLIVIALALGNRERGGTAGFAAGVPWWTYAETQFRAVAHYLRLALWPRPLVFDYGSLWAKGPADILPYALLVGGLLALTLAGLWRRPAAGFLGTFFFAILAPTSLVPVVVQTMAERRMYLALAPVIIVLVAAIRAGLARAGATRLELPLWCAVGLALGTVTAARNRDYRDNVALWGLTAGQMPDNPRAHYYYGVGLDEAGRPPEALGQYQAALRLFPAYPEAHNRRGIEELKAGDPAAAMADYRAAIRGEPDFPDAHYNLGSALAQSGRLPEAIDELRSALRAKPAFPEAELNLGLALAQARGPAEAIPHYEAALRLRPDYAAAETNLGAALAAEGRLPEAIGHFERAVRLEPDSAPARRNLERARILAGAR